MVCTWVGKEFTDMRQNEREITFIRVGDTVRTVGQLKGEPMLNKGPLCIFIPRVQGAGQGLCRSLADWKRQVYWVGVWGGKVREILSPYGVERKTGHTAQQNLESVNSYNMVGGCRETYDKGLFFFCSCILHSQVLLFFFLFFFSFLSFCSFILGTPQ